MEALTIIGLVLFRIAASLAGSGCYVYYYPGRNRRECLLALLPGVAIGICVVPIACEIMAGQGLPWIHCGEWRTDVAMSFAGGLLGTPAIGFALQSFPVWLQKRFGLPPPRDPNYRAPRPDSDATKA